ncbi:MAG: hypothetical protein COU81_01620 [Candidatus Portnoybacteria bacterium CG10_big_fil_rev_8_21_14_0_10_36_7]|uniref:Major facilitator superfamily (MFS) profile domain-containing protein n=1 Tax=Candidatus Portnoybacteria bacterium CG10_big_fil_rev_8_21_14_0_10_36_7 TaxID=1974812 RepID=A0A2M8KEC9_9BACT|nr:MAG: hypothetical protein COU81_01620 [Candidatus Portnoybacteria bacterium CG10_big_fil_rev_8_21_14_0_10_36_7]
MARLNKIIKALIISDAFFLSAIGILTPIFAIFLISQIDGGTIEVAGIAAAIYLIVRTIFLLPVSNLIDKKKGEYDDLFFLVSGLVVMALTMILYTFAKTVWNIYLLQAVLGVGAAMHYPAWYVLFTRHIGKFREGFAWGVYEVVIGISGALTVSAGAFVANIFGFEVLFLVVAMLILAGAFMPLLFLQAVTI